MPRVAIKKKDYMISDLSEKIFGRMHSMNIRQREMGALLGITQQAFSQKLQKSKFNYGELLSIFKRLEFTDEEILRLMKL